MQRCNFAQLFGKSERLEIWNACWNYPHDHRATAALNENVYAKPGHAGQGIRDIAVALLAQHTDRSLVAANQVGSDTACVVCAERTQSLQFDGNKLTVHLYLQLPAG